MKAIPATDAEIESAASIACRLRPSDLGRYLTEYVMYHRVQADIPRLQAAIASEHQRRKSRGWGRSF
jgi:hypothetical protein